MAEKPWFPQLSDDGKKFLCQYKDHVVFRDPDDARWYAWRRDDLVMKTALSYDDITQIVDNRQLEQK